MSGWTDLPSNPAWRALPVLSRALHNELMLTADEIGTLPIQGWEATADAVVRLLRAHSREARDVADAVAPLMSSGWIVREQTEIVLPCRSVAQAQSPGAKRQARYRANKNRTVYERDAFTCRYCGASKGVRLAIDHVVPRCQGGADTDANKVVSCWPCNSRKGGRTPEQAGMRLMAPRGAK